MIWATVSSQSCFCWLYRASTSLAVKNIQPDFGVGYLVMSMCRVFSCVVACLVSRRPNMITPTNRCHGISCVWHCNPIDGSPPGSPVPGILQATTLEWVAIFFSNAWKWKVKGKLLSRVRLLATPWTAAHQARERNGRGRRVGVWEWEAPHLIKTV